MRKLALLATCSAVAVGVAAAIAGGAQRSGPKPHGTVFVTERNLVPGSVTAFDAESGQPIWTARTGVTPIGVSKPQGTHKVYTSDEGSNQMSVFDEQTGTLLATIPMGLGPHHLMASRNGKRIYVGEFLQNTVGVIDTETDTVLAHYPASELPDARTHSVYITRDGSDLYAANTRADRSRPGDVAHIDARTGALLCNTGVGVDPSEVLVRPGGKLGYVSVRGENKIKELDLRTNCPVLTGREAVIGPMPDTLQLTSDRRLLVVTLRGIPAQISLLDTRTFAVQIVNIPGHSTTGHHWLSRDGRLSYVAVENPAGVAVVDNETGAVVADYAYPNPPGGSRAHGVFFEARRLDGADEDGGDDD
jgi:YVTN family beta-propeller protein